MKQERKPYQITTASFFIVMANSEAEAKDKARRILKEHPELHKVDLVPVLAANWEVYEPTTEEAG